MVFKLVRIDTQDPSKIQLAIGTHIIGRGKFLHNDDTDKRVSRNHAEMEVTTDTIQLKSLHQNPCFYIKKSTLETQILQQDNTVSLCHGDKFGLLPDYFWYEVLHCPDQDIKEERSVTPELMKNGLHGREEQKLDEIEVTREESNVASETSAAGDNGETINFEGNEEVLEPNRSASPSLLTENQESTEGYDVNPQLPLIDGTRSPGKRNHSVDTSPVDTKKVKTEPPDAADKENQSMDSSPVDTKKVKTEPLDAAGPSNQQQASADTGSKADTVAPASPAKPTAPLRERCIYGANCYRRNPLHKAQFSHPCDADWGGGARGACPYGRACRRRDPRHWAAHDHPPGTQQPTHHVHRPGKRQKRRQREVSVSDEDSPVDDLIVTGKRARKTVIRQDWSGSESEGDEDPYKTDEESDEWQPPSDVTNSQGATQDY